MIRSLSEIYRDIDPEISKVYVVPLIRYTHKRSDYLYLLYRDLLESDEYEIDSISVFQHFRLITGILKNKKAVLHYHWLEFQDLRSILGMPWKMLCIRLFTLLGGHLVWTIHNEFPHDKRFLLLHKFLHKKMAQWSTRLHVHCEKAIDIMKPRLKKDESAFRVMEHPLFPAESLSRNSGIEMLKNQLGLIINANFPLILMFGNISEYKQIGEVADLMIQNDLRAQLLVAGPVKKGNMGLYKKLNTVFNKHANLFLYPHFVSEEQISWFFSASDLCVFNYREILSSGGVQMARSHNKPVLAPDMGCLSELKDDPNVELFLGPDELESCLKSFCEKRDNG